MFSNFLLFPIGHLTHPPTSKVFLDFWNFFLFTWPLSTVEICHVVQVKANEKKNIYLYPTVDRQPV